MKKNNGPLRDVLIIDAQNDFVSGSLACQNGEEAITHIIDYLNRNQPLRVFYSQDDHPAEHCSFETEGGPWPPHCVQGSPGVEIHQAFINKLMNPAQAPHPENVFVKGQSPEVDEYSAFDARTRDGVRLNESLKKEILLCGMATEYCVKETAHAFASAGFDVAIYLPGLAYVNLEDHRRCVEEFIAQGFQIVES